MDAERFDALSRALTTPGSRRTILLALLAGSLPGAPLETLAKRHTRHGKRPDKKGDRPKIDPDNDSRKHQQTGTGKEHRPQEQRASDEQTLDSTEEVAAAETREVASEGVTRAGCRRAGARCKRGQQCCTRKCLRSGKCSCNPSAPCPQPTDPCKKAVCSAGRCVIQNLDCGDGKVCCGTGCIDTRSDPDHCGSCANQCTTEAPATCGETGECIGGECARYGAETVCRATSCQGSVLIKETRCNGSGGCPAVEQESCDDGNACTTDSCDAGQSTCHHVSLANFESCGETNYCFNGLCVACAPAAAPCLDNRQCCGHYAGNGACLTLGGTGFCCQGRGTSCQTTGVCCSRKCYKAAPSSLFGTCVDSGCINDGENCNVSDNCCSNNCVGGVCRPPGT